MSIDRIWYRLPQSRQSVYDDEELTSLELSGRTADKVNECIDEVNDMADELSTFKSDVINSTIPNIFGNFFGKIYNVLEYGAEGGTVDDYAAIIEARDLAEANDGLLYFPGVTDGYYSWIGDITFTNTKILIHPNAKLKPRTAYKIIGDSAQIYAGLYQIIDLSDGGLIQGTWDINEVYPEWFGAIGDNSTDNATALNNTVAFCLLSDCKLYTRPTANYRINSQVSFLSLKRIEFNGSITVNFEGVGVLLGHVSSQVLYGDVYFRQVRDVSDTVPANALIRIQGLKNSIIRIGICKYVELYADTDNDATSSIAYNQFFFNRCDQLILTTNPSPSGSTTQWINENTFWGGRFKDITIEGTYTHNNNTFYRPTLEGCTLTLTKGSSNAFLDVRTEGTCEVTFGETTHTNIITQQWTSISRSGDGDVSISITDNGVNNCVRRNQWLNKERFTLFQISKNTLNFNESTENGAIEITPGLDKLTVSGSKDCYESELIPVIPGTSFDLLSDGDSWRYRYYIYDEDKNLITGDDEGYMSIAGITWNTAGYYQFSGSNVENSKSATVISADVKYVKVVIRSGSAPEPFKYVQLFVNLKKQYEENIKTFIKPVSPIVLSSSPTQGFAKLGQIISKDVGGTYQCTKSLDRFLDGTIEASGTSATVDDNTDVANGDIVGILLDDGTTHWTTVSNLTGSTFDIDAIPSQASDGNRIVFNLWV
jgi:hypothetical protein